MLCETFWGSLVLTGPPLNAVINSIPFWCLRAFTSLTLALSYVRAAGGSKNPNHPKPVTQLSI